MGQRYSFYPIVFLCCLVSGLAHGTRYTIESTIDAVGPDGICSLREAVQAITDQSVVEECEAGTASNVITLTPGETYPLTGGQLVLGDGTESVSLALDVARNGPFDREVKENAVIAATSADRVFSVLSSATLSLSSVTLQGGATAIADNGGLVNLQGRLESDVNSSFLNGQAVNGGAVYLSGGQASMSVSESRFSGNSASASGGAIASDASFQGIISLQNVYMDGNNAALNGGAMYLSGAPAAGGIALDLGIANSTIYGNSADNGSAIYVDAPARRTILNNVTIAGNDAVPTIPPAAPHAALVYSDHVPVPTDDRDKVLNSVVVGNEQVDCSFTGNASNHAYLSYLVSSGCGAAGGGLDAERPGFNSDAADFSVLLDADGSPCPATTGSTACSPSTDFESGFAGFLPNSLAAGPAAYDAGSPLSAVTDTCFGSTDQRGADRADRCDAGALEFQLSQGVRDEFVLVQGRTEEIDVLDNDQGDNPISCVAAFTVPVTLPVLGATPGAAGVSDCVEIPVVPREGVVRINIDAAGYPTLSYTSNSAFHGLDTLRYSISKDAVEGSTFADGDLSAQVTLVVEPATGFTESENIDDLGGATSWGHLLLVLLMAALRRFRVALMCGLVSFSISAHSAEIRVNTLLDSLNYGDDLCSIREALGNSVDSIPDFSPDCAPGATGRDTIILPAGTITLSAPLQIANSSVEFEGQGVGVTILESGGAWRLITASSSVRMRFLSLRNGDTSGSGGAINTTGSLSLVSVEVIGNQADGDGGAIFLNFNSDERRDVTFDSVLFRGNQAQVDGGAVAMIGQLQQHDIEISASTFDSNIAGQFGGGMDVNLAEGGALEMANTTFTGNVAAAGGSAIDLQDAAANVRIMNSIFLNENSGGAVGAIDIGNATAAVQINHSVYANAGMCSSGSSRFTSASQNNLFSSPRHSSCEYPGEDLPPDPNATNNSADASDIAAVFGGALVPAAGASDDYIPPHFAIDPSATASPAYALIVDAGAEGDLRPGFTGPDRCRLEDLRGESREAGARCDLGAFELQVATAVPDEDDNSGRDDRSVIVDILSNDLAGEGGTILTGTIAFTTLPAAGTVTVVSRENEGTLCGTFNGGGAADDCVVLYEAPPGLTCADFEDDPFEETFSYEFDYTSTVGPAGTSVSGADNPGDDLVVVSIDNVGPTFQGQTRYTEPGIPVVFPLVFDDPDSAIEPSNFTITREPQFAKKKVIEMPGPDDDIVTADGAGIVINPANRTVTYYQADVSKSFNDFFELEVEDECGDTATAGFRVRYNTEDSAGGELIGGGGSLPVLVLAGMLVSGRCRRRQRFCG